MSLDEGIEVRNQQKRQKRENYDWIFHMLQGVGWEAAEKWKEREEVAWGLEDLERVWRT